MREAGISIDSVIVHDAMIIGSGLHDALPVLHVLSNRLLAMRQL